MTLVRNLETDPALFHDVVFLVEATTFEKFQYYKYCEDIQSGSFISERESVMIHIATLDNRPINVQLEYANVCGHRVMFWDPVSQLVDYKLVEAWFEQFRPIIRKNAGDTLIESDAQNFRNWRYYPRKQK